MKARILSIEANSALVSVMDDGCSTVSCEGCSCSKKLKTMKIDLPENENWKIGEIISLTAPGALSDALLLLGLPLGASAALSLSGLSPALSLLGGAAAFSLMALLLRLIRGKKNLTVRRLP